MGLGLGDIMKRIIGILAVGLLASAAFGGDLQKQTRTVTATATNKATAVTASFSGIRGKILEIRVDLATATTGTVVVAVNPELSTMADITLYTGTAITSDVVNRTTFPVDQPDGTDRAAFVPFVSIGDEITATVSNFDATSKVVNVEIIYSKQ